jgi:hypothetical protein
MAAAQSRPEIITFKVDTALLDAMRGIANRSEFIRNAVLAALNNLCPLCRGTGTMTPSQRRHWDAFAARHSITECDDCHAFHLVCPAAPETEVHEHRPRRKSK